MRSWFSFKQLPISCGSVSSPNEAKYYRLTSHTASSDPNADYYKQVSGVDDLASIFESISSDVTSFTSKVTLDATAILKDVLADGFVLTNDTAITVSVVPGTMGGNAITGVEATVDAVTDMASPTNKDTIGTSEWE